MTTGHAPGVTHMCYGADEYGCDVGWGCTIEDGSCSGAARCSDCVSADMREREREDPYWDYD